MTHICLCLAPSLFKGIRFHSLVQNERFRVPWDIKILNGIFKHLLKIKSMKTIKQVNINA